MSDWWAFLALYERVLVWPLAILFALLALTAKSVRNRVLYTGFLIGVFLPHIQKAIGDVYFDHLCRTQAGEFVYATVHSVVGIVELRPRDYSKDFFDEAAEGRHPEDPVGHIVLGWGGERGGAFVQKRGGVYHATYQFHEIVVSKSRTASGDVLWCDRYSAYDKNTGAPRTIEKSTTCLSAFGYTYSGIVSPVHRILGITGGQTEVVALSAVERPLAVFRGFVRVGRRYDACPKIGMGTSEQPSLLKFITRVLVPINSPNGR